MTITKNYLKERHDLITPYIHRTPVMSSVQVNRVVGVDVVFKCENFQRMGAFKMRGATNAILNLTDEERKKGVVTHSSGNFAQAVSLAAKQLGLNAQIVMPENAPAVKKEAVRGYGGTITECESTAAAREAAAAKIVNETGATFLHPSNDIDVIVGQATCAIELIDDYPELNTIVAPVGGGGLIAGCCLTKLHMADHLRVVGAEPENADDAYRSLISGKIENNERADTIADGLRTHLGDINFPIIQHNIDRIIKVKEKMIVKAMKLIYERMKIVVEPSSAVALAAIMTKPNLFANQKVGVILSGGNVDLSKLPF